MGTDTVHFDSQGNYTIGDGVQQMAVERKSEPSPAALNKGGVRVFNGGASAQPAAKKPSFDLNTLRSKAASAKKPAPVKAAEPVEEAKPVEVEELASPAEVVIQEESPVTREEKMPAEPVPADEETAEEVAETEATTPNPEPMAVESTEVASMSLSMQGLEVNRGEETPGVLEEASGEETPGVSEEMSNEETDATPPEVVLEETPEDATESVGDTEEPPVIPPVEEEVKEADVVVEPDLLAPQDDAEAESGETTPSSDTPSAPVKTMNLAEPVKASNTGADTDTPFDIINLPTLLQDIGLTSGELVDWILKVEQGYRRYPTAVFSSAEYPRLRAYAVIVLSGRKAGFALTLGYDTRICAVRYSNKQLQDFSTEISIDGTCAIIQDMPVASCSQRANESIVL